MTPPGKSFLKQRLARLRAALDHKGVDAAIVTEPKHIFYLTGFSMKFPGLKNHQLLRVDRNAKTTLFVSAPLAETAAKCAHTVVEVPHSKVSSAGKRERAFLDGCRLSAPKVQRMERAVTPCIVEMRRCKDRQEQRALRRLGALADYGYAAIRESCVAGATELDLLLAAKRTCIDHAGRDLFVSGDFLSGSRTLHIGGAAGRKKLRSGQNVITDLWLVDRFYWSDTCRTFRIEGRGHLRDGDKADLCVFDAGLMRDTATIRQPNRLSEGVKMVFMEGRKVYADRTDRASSPG